MNLERYILDKLAQDMAAEIDREIMAELMTAIRGWFYFVPKFVYYVPPPTVYAGVE